MFRSELHQLKTFLIDQFCNPDDLLSDEEGVGAWLSFRYQIILSQVVSVCPVKQLLTPSVIPECYQRSYGGLQQKAGCCTAAWSLRPDTSF